MFFFRSSNRKQKENKLKLKDTKKIILLFAKCEICELCFVHETQNPTDTQIYVLHKYYIYDDDDGLK